MSLKLENKLLFLAIFFIFFLLFLKSFYTLDPDFGWHLKMGELILSSSIPKTDPFSYTMPSFPFVDHEWGSNILIYILYKTIGFLGLSIIFSLIPILAMLTTLKFKSKNFFTLPILLVAGTLFIFIGIRTQVITWLFFSLLIRVLLEQKSYLKLRFLFPFFATLWANLHGGFALGIFTYFLFLALEIYRQRKVNFPDLAIFILSVFATLINPYGIRLWGEVYMQMSDSTLRWSITEWMPSFFSFYPPLWLYLAISCIFFIRFRKSFGIFEKTLYLGLLIEGVSSIRHMALWALFALPILSKSLFLFSQEAKKIKYGQERFKKAYVFFIILTFIIILLSIVSISKSEFSYNDENFYPQKAINYLKTNPSSGEVFSEYTWGGYLIWKYPEKKVFVDGRMPSWRWNANIKNESNYAFSEYRNILYGKMQFNDAVKKYNIDTVLFPAPSDQKKKSYIQELAKLLEDKFNLDKEENRDDIYTELKKSGWKIVYEDDIAVIYRKP